MKLFSGSIRKKLVILVLLATTPAFLMLLGTELANRQHAVHAARQDTASFLKGFAEVQQRITDSTHTLLRTVASIPVIMEGDVEESRIILSTLLETNPLYTNVILVDRKGYVVAAGKNHEKALKMNFGERKQFKDAVAAKGFAAGEYTVGKTSREAIFPFGMAVLDDNGEAQGAIIIGVRLDHYKKLYNQGKYFPDTFLGLCDHKGIRLFRYPESEKTGIGLKIKKEVYEAATKTQMPGSVSALASDGKERVIVYEPVRIANNQDPYMYMFMGFSYEQIIKEAQGILIRLAITSFLSISLALAIAWFIGGSSIAGRIEALTRMTKKFSEGKEDVSSGIEYSDGEIGSLAESFDNMVRMLHEREEERNEAVEQLRISEQRFREMIEDVSAISVQGYNEKREVTFWNHASEDLYGFSREEAIGKRLEELIIPEHMRNEVIRLHEQWLSEGIKIPSGELTLIDRDGNDVEVFSSHVMHDTKMGKEMFCVDIDMAPIKRAEAETKALLARLSQSQKMDAVGQLAGGIAHDFNNMLGGIMGAGEMLALYLPDDPKAHTFHKIILKSAGRAADLTSKLLTFSRDTNKDSTAVNVHDLITETVVLLENTLDRRIGVELELRAQASTVVGDSSQLQNVFLNIAINGSHAMPKGGTLTLSTRIIELDRAICNDSAFNLTPGKHIEITIEDSGHGIPPEDLTKIFEPFFTTKEQGKGTGLGLSAVYGTIKQHNGSVHAYSKVGVGTKFTIQLPLADSTEITSQHDESIKKGDGTILLVDDEEAMRVTGQAILEEMGYTVLLAENGKEAVDIFQSAQPPIDLVILDMIMPVMDGRDCYLALQRLNPQVKVLISSGFTRDEDLEELHKLGLKDYIRKPYRKGLLSQTVHDALL